MSQTVDDMTYGEIGEQTMENMERALDHVKRTFNLEVLPDGEAGQAIRHLTELAFTDPLTGAFNRRFLDIYLDDLVKRDADFTVVMFDHDDFKQLNDRFGHDRGDDLLIYSAAHAAKFFRGKGVVARQSGAADEFVVVLESADAAEAATWADAFRNHVAACDEPRHSTTISVGVVQRRKGEDRASIMKRADAAMYKAKHLGGNTTRAEV